MNKEWKNFTTNHNNRPHGVAVFRHLSQNVVGLIKSTICNQRRACFSKSVADEPTRTSIRYRTTSSCGLFGSWLIIIATAALLFAACTSGRALEDAPIITSATHQHTLYNGRGQPIEAVASKENAPSPVITYFRSEEDLHADRNGSSEAPVEVGDYYVRIRRPAGNGYRAGNDVTVEYHIQKALVTISAEERQEFAYNGSPRAVVFSVEQNVEPDVAYFYAASAMRGLPLSGPPAERGAYSAVISWNGNAYYMGASKEVELVIR